MGKVKDTRQTKKKRKKGSRFPRDWYRLPKMAKNLVIRVSGDHGRTFGFVRPMTREDHYELRFHAQLHPDPALRGVCPCCGKPINEEVEKVCNGHVIPANPSDPRIPRGLAHYTNILRIHKECEDEHGNGMPVFFSTRAQMAYVNWLSTERKMISNPLVREGMEFAIRYYSRDLEERQRRAALTAREVELRARLLEAMRSRTRTL